MGTFLLAVAVCVAARQPAWGAPDDDDDDSLSSSPKGKYVRPLHPPHQFEQLGSNEGLPQDQVRSIIQDPQGFLWFATLSGGIARYDGYEMRTIQYNPDAEVSLPTSFTKALEIGPSDTLWIGTGDAGVAIYDPTTDEITNLRKGDNALSSDGVNVLHRDGAGTMWVGTADGVLHRFNPQGQTFEQFRITGDAATEITVIDHSEDNTLWIGTSSAGLYKFDPSSGEATKHYAAGSRRGQLSNSAVRAVLRDSQGVLWVGTDNGLNRFDDSAGTFSQYRYDRANRNTVSDNRITALYEDRAGALWIGTETGVNTFSKDRSSITRYVRDRSFPVITASYPVHVFDITQDRSGVLWFGTDTGLRSIDELHLTIDEYLNASGDGDPIALVEDDDGILWVATYKSGLRRVDRERQTITVYTHLGAPGKPDSIKLTEWMTALHHDGRGTLWISGAGLGLISFQPRTETFKQYLPDPEEMEGPTADRIERILRDAKGQLWLAMWGGGINLFDPENESFTEFMHDEDDASSLSTDYISTLLFDVKDPNTLWVGTIQGGLNKFDINSHKATRYSMVPEGSATKWQDNIYSIHQGDDGVLWVGTDGGGLVRFDPATQDKKYFTGKDGLAHNTIYGILSDNDGELWMSTNGGGISVFDPKGETFSTYNAADGLVSNEFSQNGYYKSKSGELFFSGIDGFNAIKPENIKPDTYAPRPTITRFQLFNKDVKLGEPIWMLPSLDLGYTDSVFSFEFSALSFAAPDKILYAYKMDGLHDWVETNRRFITYTNLDGGEYVFRVKATNRYGVWSEEIAAVSIEVASPPWKTWWAYSLYLLAVLAIVFAYLRYQARKVESLQQAHRLESVERELELTGAVQTGFLPRSNHMHNARFRLHGFYRPADRAGGDWWWYEEAAPSLSVLVGDVTGHGPGPAMVTAAAATAFRIQGKNHGIDLSTRLQGLNEEVLRVGIGNYQMTMSAIELDGATGHFVFHSAGGLPIMRLAREGRPRLLPCPGTPLGTKSFELGTVEGTMQPGERILIYTDGIPELQLENGRLLGMRRFSKICEGTRGLNLQEATQQIVLAADMIRQGSAQDDDWTFALVEWTG